MSRIVEVFALDCQRLSGCLEECLDAGTERTIVNPFVFKIVHKHGELFSAQGKAFTAQNSQELPSLLLELQATHVLIHVDGSALCKVSTGCGRATITPIPEGLLQVRTLLAVAHDSLEAVFADGIGRQRTFIAVHMDELPEEHDHAVQYRITSALLDPMCDWMDDNDTVLFGRAHALESFASLMEGIANQGNGTLM
jgi:hypothetical protein